MATCCSLELELNTVLSYRAGPLRVDFTCVACSPCVRDSFLSVLLSWFPNALNKNALYSRHNITQPERGSENAGIKATAVVHKFDLIGVLYPRVQC